jgi:hypothetical protein
MIEREAITWIFLELCPSNLEAIGYSVEDLWKTIASLQLTPYQITTSGYLRLLPCDKFCEFPLINIVATSCSVDLLNSIS